MLTLLVRQSLTDGRVKTWKLRSNNKPQTFGSSRLADIISISAETSGVQGIFECVNGQWVFINMDPTRVGKEQSSVTPILNDSEIKIKDFTLSFNVNKKEGSLLEKFDKLNSATGNGKGKQVQLFVIQCNQQILETHVVPLNKKFRSPLVSAPVAAQISDQWIHQTYGEIKLSQKTVSTEDGSKYGKLAFKDVIDDESKKGAYIIMAATLLIMAVGVLSPKPQALETVATPPKVAQRIIVKTEVKPKRQKAAAPAQKVEVKEAPAASTKQASQGKQDRVSKTVQSISGGRISQLIGKVSARAAKSGNVVFSNGVKAGEGNSGRALAAVGSVEKSGRDWGTEGTGSGIVISTAGKGGGKSASGMGGLAAGSTGSGGVGLIEEEGEIVGGLDREVIAQYIKSQLGQILYCYERQLSASPDLFGKVAVKFTIGPNGSVEQQLIGDTTLKNKTVEGCILTRVAAWKFPQPQGGTRVLVTYPFLFKSTN